MLKILARNHSFVAENLLLDLLGVQKPYDGGKIKIDLQDAEKAFRLLIYRLREEIALLEQKNTKT